MSESNYVSNSLGLDGKPDGFIWHVTGDDDHLALGGHEKNLGPILESLAVSERAYVNVGAHIGAWAIRMADKVSVVYAVEANSKTADKLATNVMLNKLDSKIHVIVGAAWDKRNASMRLVDEKSMQTGGSTRVEALSKDNLSLEGMTATFRLGDLHLPAVGLISIDVEGGEAHVLRGAKELIERDRPSIVVEIHQGHPGTDEDLSTQVHDVLASYNYVYTEVAIDEETMWICIPAESDKVEITPSETVDTLTVSSEDAKILMENLLKDVK